MLQEYIKEEEKEFDKQFRTGEKSWYPNYIEMKSFLTSALTTLHDKIIRGEIERKKLMKRYVHLPEGYVNDNPNFDKVLNVEDTKCMILNQAIDEDITHLKSLLK